MVATRSFSQSFPHFPSFPISFLSISVRRYILVPLRFSVFFFLLPLSLYSRQPNLLSLYPLSLSLFALHSLVLQARLMLSSCHVSSSQACRSELARLTQNLKVSTHANLPACCISLCFPNTCSCGSCPSTHYLHSLPTHPQTMQRSHTKQMEHLRFLIHNRLNAKPQASPHTAANVDTVAETAEVVSVPFDLHVRGVRSSVASAASASTAEEEHEQVTTGSRTVPAAAQSAAPSATDTAAPYDDDEDLQGQADWKESIQPIGYLRSCFRRKVRPWTG